MSFIENLASDQFTIRWKDSGGLIINMKVDVNEVSTLEVNYENGRGPFYGTYSPINANFVFQIDFTDGHIPDAGKQVGVLDFKGKVIYWGNDTQWTLQG